jgi:hypothetical protein
MAALSTISPTALALALWGFLPIASKRFNSQAQLLKHWEKHHLGQVAKTNKAREFRTLSFAPYWFPPF